MPSCWAAEWVEGNHIVFLTAVEVEAVVSRPGENRRVIVQQMSVEWEGGEPLLMTMLGVSWAVAPMFSRFQASPFLA